MVFSNLDAGFLIINIDSWLLTKSIIPLKYFSSSAIWASLT